MDEYPSFEDLMRDVSALLGGVMLASEPVKKRVVNEIIKIFTKPIQTIK